MNYPLHVQETKPDPFNESFRHFFLCLFCRCTYFFLYDGCKVKGEGDLTREGICYFYPEEVSHPHDKASVCVYICTRRFKLGNLKVGFYLYFCQTPLDKQELLCGQLAGTGRCVSELSSSPVRILRLRHNTFSIRMKDDLFWVSEHTSGSAATFQDLSDLKHIGGFFLFLQALGCSVEVSTVSVCELLDQLINLFCFYNGSVRRSYQVHVQLSSCLITQKPYFLSGFSLRD